MNDFSRHLCSPVPKKGKKCGYIIEMHFPIKHDANISNTVGELLMIAEWILKEYFSVAMNRII